MRPDEYWKNFNLGTELDIAGRFLFNGLQAFHEMRNFAAEEDAFEFLYGVAVGIERLLKIAVILTEHDTSTDQAEFEKGLITHSHQELVKRLKESHEINLAGVHNEFIGILSSFYKSQRYGRYNLASVYGPARERDDLNAFLEKHLSFKIDIEGMFTVTPNERRHKKFVGKVISKIVLPIFQIIRSEAGRLNLYTYEVEYGSKASKIFIGESFDFEGEDFLQVELIAYFASGAASGPNVRFIRDLIAPLPFDPALEADYLAALRSDRQKQSVLDELEAHYEEVEDFRERRETLEVAISDHLSYGEDEDGSEENFD
ncbi:hypothetical protein [Thioclava electrotropha]|uniref:Uncharacterized protein n=1 Tax=Thioclava electrotropha TaxID=1549850 RepID=A0ABX6YUX3_9RHOB|nr:hypothetical protein [Thioclava electrotropha]QPZ91656.1 hypothetical protein AKL02_012650 [Thioclava electrotropha]